MSGKTRSSGIKDALVIKHCIKMWPVLIKREESAFCNESWRLSKPYTAKSVTRQSCIPLCNIGSSSGNSSQGNFAWKDAMSKRSFFKQYHAYQFNFHENPVHGTSVVGNQGIFVPDNPTERLEHNGNLNITDDNIKQGHAALLPTSTSCESTGNACSSTYELSNFDDTVDEKRNNKLCTPLTTRQLNGSFATKNKIVNIHGSLGKHWIRNRVRQGRVSNQPAPCPKSCTSVVDSIKFYLYSFSIYQGTQEQGEDKSYEAKSLSCFCGDIFLLFSLRNSCSVLHVEGIILSDYDSISSAIFLTVNLNENLGKASTCRK